MIGICKNEHGWYISKHNKQLGVKYYKTLTEECLLPMQKNIRADLMKDLYKEIPKATTRDLGSIIDFLKKAREVREGKTKKRREARKKYVEKQLEKADLPIWW